MADLYAHIRALWLLWLVLLFIGIVAWVYWPSRKKKLEAHGRIPFEEEPVEPRKEER